MKEKYKTPITRDRSIGRPRLAVTVKHLMTFHNLGCTRATSARLIGKTSEGKTGKNIELYLATFVGKD